MEVTANGFSMIVFCIRRCACPTVNKGGNQVDAGRRAVKGQWSVVAGLCRTGTGHGDFHYFIKLKHTVVHTRSHSTPINLEPGEKACSHRTASGVLRRCRPDVLKSHPFSGTGAGAHPGARAGQTCRAARTLVGGSPDSRAGMRGARPRHPPDVRGRPTRGCGRGHGHCQSRSRACPHARRRTRRPMIK